MNTSFVQEFFGSSPAFILSKTGSVIAKNRSAGLRGFDIDSVFCNIDPYQRILCESAFDCPERAKDMKIDVHVNSFSGTFDLKFAKSRYLAFALAVMTESEESGSADGMESFSGDKNDELIELIAKNSEFLSHTPSLTMFDLKTVTERTVSEISNSPRFSDLEITFSDNTRSRECLTVSFHRDIYIKTLIVLLFICSGVSKTRKISIDINKYGDETEIRAVTDISSPPSEAPFFVQSLESSRIFHLCKSLSELNDNEFGVTKAGGKLHLFLRLARGNMYPDDFKSSDQFQNIDNVIKKFLLSLSSLSELDGNSF